jgi:hypothetical protein
MESEFWNTLEQRVSEWTREYAQVAFTPEDVNGLVLGNHRLGNLARYEEFLKRYGEAIQRVMIRAGQGYIRESWLAYTEQTRESVTSEEYWGEDHKEPRE